MFYTSIAKQHLWKMMLRNDGNTCLSECAWQWTQAGHFQYLGKTYQHHASNVNIPSHSTAAFLRESSPRPLQNKCSFGGTGFFSPHALHKSEKCELKIGASFGSDAEDLGRVTEEEGGEKQEVLRK